ncbi:zinc finger protein 599-like [Anthonomus grandis grandis]|uniref:zinc finger protein 599-like n=1 Tax=Anthonomus grandis grandis TaxID=2921223 RepID=UPI002165197E|nr:zinc finger protein 599-like [Anthonomus grandis grandis]
MECNSFTEAEISNLQRLIDSGHSGSFTEDEIRDSDILYFSQFGDLQGTENDKIEILQGDDSSNASSSVTSSEELTRALSVLPSTSDYSFTGAASSATVPVKTEAFGNYAIAKYKEINGKSIRVFECGICGKEFGQQYTLIRHLPTHTDERNFHCDHCGKSFRQMSTLSQHKAIHSAERPYVCEVCNKTFNRVSTLISHRKTHTGLKPHRCHLCNKAFHQKGNLRNHIFTHTNERPYKCEVCEKGFNQMSNLVCHKIKAHQYRMDAIQKYQCKICGENFLKRVNLREHEQVSHGTANQPGRELVNAIIVEPIKTEAMKKAMLTGDTPFALLRPLSGVPVLVRVLPAGPKQLLVPATAEDLKKFSHISIKAKVPDENPESENDIKIESKGCVVQIKVPVVATVIQKLGPNGSNNPMTIMSPDHKDVVDERGGPLFDLNTDSFVYTSTFSCNMDNYEENENSLEASASSNTVDKFSFAEKYDHLIGNIQDTGAEFIGDEHIGGDSEKMLDATLVEYNFDIPQDARDDPACPPRTSQESQPVVKGLSMPDVSDPTESESSAQPSKTNLSNKIIIENDGEFIELPALV